MVYSKEINNPKVGVIFGIIFALIGVGLIIFSFINIKNYNEKNKTFIEVNATVIDYKDTYDEDGDLLRAIIVEYEVDGTNYRKTSSSSTTNPETLGSTVKVKYNPNDPKDIIWPNDTSNIILPIVGGVFTIVGIIFTVVSIKMVKNKENN